MFGSWDISSGNKNYMDPVTTSQIIGAVATLLGVVLGGALNFLTARWNKEAEDRRQLRQVAIEAAVTDWKQSIEIAKIRGELTKTTQEILPLDIYIVHMFQLFETIQKKDISSSNIEEKLRSVRKVTIEAAKAAKAAKDE